MQDINVWRTKDTTTKQLILIFIILAILIKQSIIFVHINYNMDKSGINKVIKVNTISIIIT
jgi:hypothetical protein